jgi:tRNA A37 threonylcarbamoyladenosine synthetase subunit TsaC/SUA5/YrdC
LIDGPLAGASSSLFQTSANRSGEPPPSRFDEIDPAVIDGADVAIDGGELGGDPSTVIDVTGIEEGGRSRVLREGALKTPEVERALASLG